MKNYNILKIYPHKYTITCIYGTYLSTYAYILRYICPLSPLSHISHISSIRANTYNPVHQSCLCSPIIYFLCNIIASVGGAKFSGLIKIYIHYKTNN